MSFSTIFCTLLVYFTDDMTSGYVRVNTAAEGSRSPAYRLGFRNSKRGRRLLRGQLDSVDETGEVTGQSIVYVFEEEEYSEDEICNEDIELKSRRRCSPATRIVEEPGLGTWAEISIKDGDTLARIALRYSCKIADLRRLNKLMTDQDLYGLKRVRIPVIRHGFLEEMLSAESAESCASASSAAAAAELVESVPESQSQQAERLLLQYDDDIRTIASSTQSSGQPDSGDAESVFIRPPVRRQLSKSFNWKKTLTIILLFFILIPTLYVLKRVIDYFWQPSV